MHDACVVYTTHINTNTKTFSEYIFFLYFQFYIQNHRTDAL